MHVRQLFLITVLTVSFKTTKAAVANPVKSLRSELAAGLAVGSLREKGSANELVDH